MADYLLLFVGLQGPTAGDPTADYTRQWNEYMGGLAQAGKLKAGGPLEPGGKTVSKDGATDFHPETVDVGGYILVSADSVDDAAAIAGGAPHIALGGTTIVRPCAPVGAG